MKDDLPIGRVVELLSDAIAQRRLPERSLRLAERLSVGLMSPVRITVMGPPGAGKRALVNALVENAVVPADLKLPTFEAAYGETEILRVTGRDRSTHELGWTDLHDLKRHSPSFVQLIASWPVLREITLLNLVTDGSDRQQLAAAKWAAQRTDIAIWVTSDFTPGQLALWQVMPDAMRSHCFLAIVGDGKSDRGQGAPASPRRGRPAGHDQFLGVYPVTLAEGTELAQDKATDALRKEIMRCVALGRQADFDQALLFLKRYTDANLEDVGGGKRQAKSCPPKPDKADQDDFALESDMGDAGGQAPVEIKEQLRAALELIETSAENMAAGLDQAEDDVVGFITSGCAATVEQLGGLTSPENPLHDIALQTTDYVVLLELEKEPDAADEAVTALLQLKRAIELELAA